MTRVLITGAAGAVGAALLDTLSGSGHDVIATDIRPPRDCLWASGSCPWTCAGQTPIGSLHMRHQMS